VLPKGFPAAKLVALIEDLLSQRENDNRIEPASKEETKTISEGGANTDWQQQFCLEKLKPTEFDNHQS